MFRLQSLTAALLALLIALCGCDGQEDTSDSAAVDSQDTAIVDDGSAGTDVTDEYISEGKDERVSPHGKTRSSIPDSVILCDVDYDNSNSGGSGSYTLEVDFEDGEPVRINFENGGWRHVFPIELGDTWKCSEDGITYTIHRPPGYEEE